MSDATAARRLAAWAWALPPTRCDVEPYVRLDRWSAAIWVVVAAGVAVRYHEITTESLWLDEVVSYWNAADRYDSSLELVLTTPTVEPHPPLYYLLLDWWTGVFGTTELGLRSMSLAFGAVTILLTYLLVVKLYDDRASGVIAAALVAVSSMHVYLAQETRMYTLFTALTLASFYWYVDVVFTDSPSRASVLRYVVATALLGYTHTFATFVVLAQNVAVAVHLYRNRAGLAGDGLAESLRRSPLVRRWVPIQAGVALLLAPWLVLLAAHALGIPIVDLGDTDWIPAEPFWYLLGTAEEYLFYNLFELPVWGLGLLVYVAAGIACFAVLDPNEGVIAGNAEGNKLSFSPSDRDVTVAVWLLVPTVVPFFLSHLLDPIYRHKYTIAASLAFFVLIARGIGTLGEAYGDGVRVGLALLLVGGVAAGVPATYDTPQKSDWRGGVAAIEANVTGEGPHVLTTPEFMNQTVQYYAESGTTVRGIPVNATWDGSLADAVDGRDQVWIAVSTWRFDRFDYQALESEFDEGGYEPDGETGRFFQPGVYVLEFERADVGGRTAVDLNRTAGDESGDS